MALFEQKIWTDRQVQFPARRKLTNVSTQEEKTVLVERNEGTVYEEGNLFNAANMNDLEERVASTFNEIEEAFNNRINLYYPPGKIFMAVTDLHLEDPEQTVFPGTTWEKLENRVLLPINPADTTQESGTEGGNEQGEITLSGTGNVTSITALAHSLTVDELPIHRHSLSPVLNLKSQPAEPDQGDVWKDSTYTSIFNIASDITGVATTYKQAGASSHSHTMKVDKVNNQPVTLNFDNIQQCITVFCWQRIS